MGTAGGQDPDPADNCPYVSPYVSNKLAALDKRKYKAAGRCCDACAQPQRSYGKPRSELPPLGAPAAQRSTHLVDLLQARPILTGLI